MRYLKKNGTWSAAPTTDYGTGEKEAVFENMGDTVNPVEELIKDKEVKSFVDSQLKAFLKFESKIKP